MKVVLAAPVKTLSGYGARSRDIALALINSGFDVNVIATPWGDTPTTGLDLNNPEHKKIHERLIPGLNQKPDVWIQITIPMEFQPIGEYNIGITAGIETTACRPEWLEGCNKMDLILTSSDHSKKVFESTQFEKRDTNTNNIIDVVKLKVPCEVLFEGVDIDIFKKKNCTDSTINSFMDTISEDFVFLFVGHWLQGDIGQDRKDIGMLVHTFLTTFLKKAPQNRPALLLKTSHANFSRLEYLSIEKKLQRIMDLVCEQTNYSGELPKIYVLHGELTDAEMSALYNHSKIKAMVSFTKGEGYGRPLLEFTTTGKPVICSGWSGQLDFLNPEFSYLLPGQVMQVHPSAVNEWIISESGWFTVNYTYAAQILESIVKSYDKFLDKSKKHINITKNNFSLNEMAKKLNDIITGISRFKEQKQILQPELKPFTPPKRIDNEGRD